MEALDYCYKLLFFILQFYVIGADYTSPYNYSCAPGVATAGVTVPKGDIVIEYGNPLEIFCMLNPTISFNSSSLRFFHDDYEVSQELLNIVNKTTLRLYVEKPPISNSLYSCKLMTAPNNYEGVCLNYVFVGTKPQKVQNFSCISYNWESLNCSWVPARNPIVTKYNITYALRGKYRKVYQCPDRTDVISNYCLWNTSTNPPHRLPHEEYYFKLIGENKLGSLQMNFIINHYAVVLPRKPENLSLVDATSSSLTISWVIPLSLRMFPPGVKNKVMYQSKWDPPNYWQEVNTSHVMNSSERRTLNITGLKYAHTVYDIRVLLKSEKASNDEKWWSEPATITLRTKATVPGMPPKTDVGSFESKVRDTLRSIYIYWQQIPQNKENGEHFEYKILRIEEYVGSEWIERNDTPSVITKTYALFKNMSTNKYVFTIVSSNKEGISKTTAQVVVPSKDQSLAEPVFLKKIAYEHGVYELSWNSPPHSHNVISYTIFWCDNKNDRPYQCNGPLNWTRVSSNITEKNITLPADKIFQFAISANTNFSSSGMLWADCTVLPDQERGKLKNIWINRIGATFMELSWKLECLQIPGIIGFNVSYCPISDPQDLSCREPLKYFLYKGDHTTSHARVEPLRPYTTYKVSLAIVSKMGTGLMSDPLLNTTMEAAPNGPPENIKVIEVTNSSITVSWSPPSLLNGVLRYYIIYWNNNSTHVEDKSPVVTKKLSNLLSYEEYDIKVSACTVDCSGTSSMLSVKTKIGMPGQVLTPKVNYFNLTEINVTWNPLETLRGGNVDFYIIKIESFNEKDTIISKRFYNKSESASNKDKRSELGILTPGCLMSSDEQVALYYNVYVRAVNVDSDGSVLAGPWSIPAKGFCHLNKSLSTTFKIFLSLIGFLAVIVSVSTVPYVGYRLYKRYRSMQNIRVKLPPQLELDIYKDKANDLPITAHVCSSQHKIVDDTNDIPPPDQQLLLDKKDKEESVESSTEDCEDVNADRESSGCGSGHESVSSSITAGTHITDSGTEADERAATPDVFSDSPRRPDLRQRNVSGSGSGGDGYSRLAQVASGYVTLPPISRGTYVKHDWIPNPRTTPFEITETQASQNTNSARPHSLQSEASWTS